MFGAICQLNFTGKCEAIVMFLGKVIGNVISTQKTGKVEGLPLLVVQQLDENLHPIPKTFACTDTVNAKSGEVVLTCSSSSARQTKKTKEVCTDNTIIAIVDIVSSQRNELYRK
jgi:microcompartment protein CcmK/EutM